MKYLRSTFFPMLLRVMLVFAGIGYSVAVTAQQATYTYTADPTTHCAPATLSFKNTSTGVATSYQWDFGDGRRVTTTDAQVTYTTPGTYRVKLTATYSTGTSEVWKDITIHATPKPDFTVDQASSCKGYTATFTEYTSNGVLRTWDFGDGSAPVTTSNNYVQHVYSKAGHFDVTVSVANAQGCTETITKYAFIKVELPVLVLADGGTEGCAPFDAMLTATVSGLGNNLVTAYQWAFGDGSMQTTSVPNVRHRYANVGGYDVTLTITTQQGCTATRTFARRVKAGTAPGNISFTVTPAVVSCTGAPVRLLADATNADDYRWDFGDGTTAAGADHDITHQFRANGMLTVRMQAGSNGCYQAAAPVEVQVNGVVARFSWQRSCTNKNEFIFTNTSVTVPGVTYEWDFGDGSTPVSSQHATHIYSQPNSYTVRLTLKDAANNCTTSDFQTLTYFRADFNTGVNTICRGQDISYGVLNVPSQLVGGYSWRFGDGGVVNTTLPDVRKLFANKGTYTDTLIIQYKDASLYCPDTIVKQHHINIIAPVADFAVSGTACTGQPVTLVNNSQPSPNIPLTSWRWQLGGGVTSTAQAPTPLTYTAAGTVRIKLVAIDARNCVDSIEKQVIIQPVPTVRATAPGSKLCEGNSITLTAQTNAAVQWSPPVGLSCTDCAVTQASPTVNSKYYVTATNVQGCSVKDSITLQVVPKVQLAVRTDTTVCVGNSVLLTSSGATHYSWSPADYLTVTNVAAPITTPAGDIVYTVTGSNDGSCPSESKQVKISVRPLPTVNAGRDQSVIVGTPITLQSTYSADVVKWEWTPKDYLDCGTCPTTPALVRKPTTYSLTVTNQYGCIKSDVVDIELICSQDVVFIPNAFSPNGDGQNDIFYVRGKGIQVIKSFRIFNRVGQEVFRRENFNIDDVSFGWNGTFAGKPQPADVYVYLLEAYCDTQDFFQLKGNITLFR
ncbi:hypothetical protein CK934_28565 [Chitinophaga sp. MD30]|nr:hypothetical protein CK934_28565 [Chitinophaga sp. MD30]